ncbi:uncharacterized protein LOC143610588 [Bidens hawaiensis]|uniref:uncharacterized protein LOC143610588 n=1 Tax=Bidens hawaiensis TaxID=980011 RepID=UPI00404B8F50
MNNLVTLCFGGQGTNIMGGRLLHIDATAITFVKTTSPKRFCVRPNSGIISPKSACDFTVTMQGLRSPPSEVDCKDKFLIQSTVVDAGTKEEEVTLELFAKGSGKYIEEKKLRVVLVAKEDSPSEEHKNKVLEKEPSNESSVKEEKVVAHKALEKEQSNESSVKKEDEVKHEVLEKEPSNESSVKDEDIVQHKVLEKEPSNESTVKEESVVENKDLEKEPSKEENVVKKDEITLPSPTVSDIYLLFTGHKTEDSKEVKGGLTTEDPKASGDHDGNEGNLSENSKPNPVKVVKEDPERKLRLFNQLKELKLKEAALENQLKEAKSTISSLTCQNSIIIEAKETLKLELARRSKKGYPFLFVCIVLIIGLISGYISDP